jgi:hypothetical protein
VGEKGLDPGSAHPSASSGLRFGWATHAVETHVAFCPADVGIPGAIGVVVERMVGSLRQAQDMYRLAPSSFWDGALPRAVWSV